MVEKKVFLFKSLTITGMKTPAPLNPLFGSGNRFFWNSSGPLNKIIYLKTCLSSPV